MKDMENIYVDNIENTIKFYNNIKHLRNKYHLSQVDIGKVVNKERSVISLWERNKRYPDILDVIKLSLHFNISMDSLIHKDLIDEEMFRSTNDYDYTYNCIPNDANLIGVKTVGNISKNYLNETSKYFTLEITDDSMSPDYVKGDRVIFDLVNDYESGKDYIVIIGSKIMFRRIIIHYDGILLQPLNTSYISDYYSTYDITSLPIKVIGVATEIRRKVRGCKKNNKY